MRWMNLQKAFVYQLETVLDGLSPPLLRDPVPYPRASLVNLSKQHLVCLFVFSVVK